MKKRTTWGRFSALLLTGSLLLSGCTPTEPEQSAQPTPSDSVEASENTYIGIAEGFGGQVTVYVTVDGNGTLVNVLAEGVDETIGKGSVALEQIPPAMVAANSLEVDVLTGATVTSEAIITAAQAALNDKIKADLPDRTAEIAYKPGTYTGTAFGHNNPLTLEVTFSADAITDITITEDKSDVAMATAVSAQVPANILADQSLNVDTVSGATETSNAVINAVASCVEQAAGAEAVTTLKTKARVTAEAENLELTADVAIVGGGGSGITTAYYTASNGQKVVILEAADILGGMTNVCGGGSLSIGSAIQKENEVYADDAEIASLLEEEYDILFKASDCLASIDFVRSYVDALDEYVDWATEAGIGYSASGKTSVRLANKGKRFDTVVEKLEALGTTILTGTRGTDLILNSDGSVGGVIGTNSTGGTTTVHAKAVVLCTGGFLANTEMCEELIPQYNEYWQNWSGSTRYQGDGITMAWEAGAAVGEVGVQPHNVMIPEEIHTLGLSTHSPNSYSTAAYYPTLWLDQSGKRFANEDLQNISPEMHGSQVMKQGIYYSILDQSTVTKLETEGSEIGGWMSTKNKPLTDLTEQIDAVIELGWAWKADTLEELAEKLGMDPATVISEVARYNELVELGEDLDFGKDAKYLDCTVSEGPYYAFANVTRMLAAYGGLDIDGEMRVLDEQGKPIAGLYAAGLDAGSFMGNVYSVTTTTAGFAICSGYMAGEGVCAYLNK